MTYAIHMLICHLYKIKFNVKKSLGIKIGSQPFMSEVLYVGKSKIVWVKHLGDCVNSDMTEETDCDMKCT